jgi:hypothetical protein
MAGGTPSDGRHREELFLCFWTRPASRPLAGLPAAGGGTVPAARRSRRSASERSEHRAAGDRRSLQPQRARSRLAGQRPARTPPRSRRPSLCCRLRLRPPPCVVAAPSCVTESSIYRVPSTPAGVSPGYRSLPDRRCHRGIPHLATESAGPAPAGCLTMREGKEETLRRSAPFGQGIRARSNRVPPAATPCEQGA